MKDEARCYYRVNKLATSEPCISCTSNWIIYWLPVWSVLLCGRETGEVPASDFKYYDVDEISKIELHKISVGIYSKFFYFGHWFYNGIV